MQKNKIERVWIEHHADEMPDTSFIGEYTDTAEDWVICRHCGEYLHIATAPNRRKAEIEDELSDLEDDTNCEADEPETLAKVAALKTELAGLSLHECPTSRREYNFFKPYAGGWADDTPEYQLYGKQDFKRMEGLTNQSWYFIGVIAKAEVTLTTGNRQVVRSGGLWGVESDGGDYLIEVGKDELTSLRAELTALGFGKRAIDYAFKNIEVEVKSC